MGGCLFFGDEMPLKKLAGISVAMVGIVWYSQVCNLPADIFTTAHSLCDCLCHLTCACRSITRLSEDILHPILNISCPADLFLPPLLVCRPYYDRKPSFQTHTGKQVFLQYRIDSVWPGLTHSQKVVWLSLTRIEAVMMSSAVEIGSFSSRANKCCKGTKPWQGGFGAPALAQLHGQKTAERCQHSRPQNGRH